MPSSRAIDEEELSESEYICSVVFLCVVVVVLDAGDFVRDCTLLPLSLMSVTSLECRLLLLLLLLEHFNGKSSAILSSLDELAVGLLGFAFVAWRSVV